MKHRMEQRKEHRMKHEWNTEWKIEWNNGGLKYLQFRKLEFLQQKSFGISISLYMHFYCGQTIRQSKIKTRQRLFATEKYPLWHLNYGTLSNLYLGLH